MGDYLKQAYEEADEKREVNELRAKLNLVCSILLRKDPLYDAWIEKNIGKEYLINGKENNHN